jgi:hypothetical protein
MVIIFAADPLVNVKCQNSKYQMVDALRAAIYGVTQCGMFLLR